VRRCFVAIAPELALLRNGVPQKGKQGFAPGFKSVTPEIGADGVGAAVVAELFGERHFLGAAEDFLPAQAVGSDEENVFCFCLRVGHGD
jgi:hypothetical protein